MTDQCPDEVTYRHELPGLGDQKYRCELPAGHPGVHMWQARLSWPSAQAS